MGDGCLLDYDRREEGEWERFTYGKGSVSSSEIYLPSFGSNWRLTSLWLSA